MTRGVQGHTSGKDAALVCLSRRHCGHRGSVPPGTAGGWREHASAWSQPRDEAVHAFTPQFKFLISTGASLVPGNTPHRRGGSRWGKQVSHTGSGCRGHVDRAPVHLGYRIVPRVHWRGWPSEALKSPSNSAALWSPSPHVPLPPCGAEKSMPPHATAAATSAGWDKQGCSPHTGWPGTRAGPRLEGGRGFCSHCLLPGWGAGSSSRAQLLVRLHHSGHQLQGLALRGSGRGQCFSNSVRLSLEAVGRSPESRWDPGLRNGPHRPAAELRSKVVGPLGQLCSSQWPLTDSGCSSGASAISREGMLWTERPLQVPVLARAPSIFCRTHPSQPSFLLDFHTQCDISGTRLP